MRGSIHLVTGQKSGGGSPLFCRILIEYFQQEPNLSLVIVEAENNSAIIGRTYAPEHYLTFGASPAELEQNDAIFELAIQGKTVVVNLPSGSFSRLYNWMKSGDFLKLSPQFGVQICQWFVSDGCSESISLLKKSYQLYGDFINHVIVKNKGLAAHRSSWLSFDTDEMLISYRQLSNTYTLEMPKLLLPDYRWEIIKRDYLTLASACARHRRGLTITEKHSVHTWRKKMFLGLDSLPLFNQIKDPFVSDESEAC